MRELLGQGDFHRAAASGQTRGRGVRRISTVKPRAYDDGSRRIRFCFSDGSVDRLGDTVNPNGWELADFMANPVALWAHDSSAPPIGRASNVKVEGGRLMGDIKFADADTYAFADTIYRLYLGQFLNAVSVGFLPIEYSFVENDPDRGWGIDFKRQELLEISPCPIPANPNALAEARAKGILSRSDLIRLREASAPLARVTDLAGARRDRDLARAHAIAARVNGRRAAPVPEADEAWRERVAEHQRMEDERHAAVSRQALAAIRLSTPTW
jgi:HK97 family phage prohead protease